MTTPELDVLHLPDRAGIMKKELMESLGIVAAYATHNPALSDAAADLLQTLQPQP